MVSKKRLLSAVSDNASNPPAEPGSKTKRVARRTPQSSASMAASLPPEIWTLIGEKLLDANATTALKSLVRVCKTFSTLLLPILYSRRIIQLERFTMSLGNPSLPPGLEYIKEFQVNISEFVGHGVYYDAENNENFAKLVVQHLTAMRRLQSFSWIDVACDNSYGLNLILNDPDLLHSLKSTPTLRSIMIQFPSQYLGDPDLAQNCFIPLKGFRDLTSLELYDFYGPHDRLAKEIANVLCECPRLKTLGLGMACDLDEYDEAVVLPYPADFLEHLCSSYGSACKGRPLALDTLRLGHGVGLHVPYDLLGEDPTEDAASDHYLHSLLDVKSLKTLEIFNGSTIDVDFDEETIPEIDWTPFMTGESTELHRIEVTRLGEETTRWLCEKGTSVRELIVSDHYKTGDIELEDFRDLPPQLNMLYTRERCESRLSGTALSISILDRLSDGGSNLKKLGLSLDFETQWERFSSHLTNLTHLIELRFSLRTFRYGQKYPHPSSSLWPGIVDPEEIGQRYIHLMSSMCPSLQYVMIGERAWQICRPNKELMRYPTRRRMAVNLRRLGFDEIRGIELFSLTTFPEHAGLLRPTIYRETVEIDDYPLPQELLDVLGWNHMFEM